MKLHAASCSWPVQLAVSAFGQCLVGVRGNLCEVYGSFLVSKPSSKVLTCSAHICWRMMVDFLDFVSDECLNGSFNNDLSPAVQAVPFITLST